MLHPDKWCAHLAVCCAVAVDGLEGGEKLFDLIHTN